MKYSVLADIYEELENTPAKLKKTEIVAGLLRKTDDLILHDLVLLLSGKLYPAWSQEEVGVADKLMIQAISKSYGVNEGDVVREHNKIGDLGLTAEEFSKSRKQASLVKKELTVEKFVENSRRITKQAGKGSQERKLGLIIELLSQADPKESRYVVRTILEQLRVGVAEGLIRDSIGKAFDVDKKLVENAWQLRPDYGEIAKIAKERGDSGLKKMKIEIGVPIKLQLAEKSPSLEEAMGSFEKKILEYKYDGMRTQIHKKGDKIWIFTRNLEDVTGAFPDLVENCKKSIKAKNCIVDGETLGIDPKGRPLPFQMLSTRIKRKYNIDKSVKEIPAKLNLFDVIYSDGKTFFDLPLEERFNELKKTIRSISGKVEFVKRLKTNDPKKAKSFYEEALSSGQEGLIIKNLEAKYVPGRKVSGGWLKVKPVMENLDLVVIGAIWGTGKRTGWLGSLVLGCREPSSGKFLECGMLGTGIKEKKTKKEDVTFSEITEMLKPYIGGGKGNRVNIRPKIVIEVAYEEIQKSPTYSSGYALRFPRFVRLRPDKSPEEADDKSRILKLYKIQKGKK